MQINEMNSELLIANNSFNSYQDAILNPQLLLAVVECHVYRSLE